MTPEPTGQQRWNPYDDFEITDPRAMRALSHPVRLRILGVLQASGPSTATELSPLVGATPSVTSWHLRHLAGFGLIRDASVGGDRRHRWWEAASRGFRFSMPEEDDEAGRAAFRQLSGQMFLQYEHLPRHWLEQVSPYLSPPWLGLGGLANTRVVVTAEELAGIDRAYETLLAPYVRRRDTESAPAGARSVRIMRYVLPQGDVPLAPTDVHRIQAEHPHHGEPSGQPATPDPAEPAEPADQADPAEPAEPGEP